MDLLDGSNDAGDGAKAGPRERRHLSLIQSSAQEAPMMMSPGSGASDDGFCQVAPVNMDPGEWRP